MTPVEYVRALCKEKKIPISRLEKELHGSNGYLNPKKKHQFQYEQAVWLSKRLECDLDPLLTDEQRQQIGVVKSIKDNIVSIVLNRQREIDAVPLRVPVLARVAAGLPLTATENIIDFEELPGFLANTGEYFGLQIKGNSMEPGILDGDTIIVRVQPDAEDGEVVVALINGDDGVCKRLKKYDNGTIALVSDNPTYEPMYFSGSEIDTIPVQVRGVVVELRRKF